MLYWWAGIFIVLVLCCDVESHVSFGQFFWICFGQSFGVFDVWTKMNIASSLCSFLNGFLNSSCHGNGPCVTVTNANNRNEQYPFAFGCFWFFMFCLLFNLSAEWVSTKITVFCSCCFLTVVLSCWVLLPLVRFPPALYPSSIIFLLAPWMLLQGFNLWGYPVQEFLGCPLAGNIWKCLLRTWIYSEGLKNESRGRTPLGRLNEWWTSLVGGLQKAVLP